MSFSKMMELLQIKNKGKIVFCNSGNFYVAIGKDAICLHYLLNLELTCIKPEICKVGFPIKSLEKYIELIQEKDYSYIVYYFNKEESVTEYKTGMYHMLQDILLISKIEKTNILYYLNKIDANLNTQRIYLRIRLSKRNY